MNGDENIRQGINNDIDRFAEVVKSNSKKRGIKWDDLALIFEWTYEIERIRDYIKNEKTVLKDHHKNAIENAFVTQQTKFDLNTIMEYIKAAEF